MKKFTTETHLIVLAILLTSGFAAANPDFFKQSLTSILDASNTKKSTVQESTTAPSGQTNISIIDARLDLETKTVSVTIRVTGMLPVEPFIVAVSDAKMLVSPGQLSLDRETVIAIPLTTITPSMVAVVDQENFIPETTKNDNSFLVSTGIK